jgi:uncharacterized protein (TIRG00374 family)
VRQDTPLVGRKSVAIMVLGLVGFVLYLYFFVGFKGLFTLLSKLNMAQYSLFFSLAIASLFLAIIFDTLIWHSLLGSISIKSKFKELFTYNWIGNFVEMVVPSATVGGELTRIALSQKDTNHDAGVAAGTVVGSRIISTVIYSTALLISFTTLLLAHQLPPYLITPVIVVSLATSVALAGVFLIAFKSAAVDRIANFCVWMARRFTKNDEKVENFRVKIYHWLNSFGEVFRTFKAKPKSLIKPAIFAVFAWLFNILVYLMVFYSLGFTHISIPSLATIYCIVTTVETVTAGIPVGAVEVTMTSLFSLYGVPIAIAAVATTLSRLLTFWCQVIVGYALVEWIGVQSLLKNNLTHGLMMKAPPMLKEE